jgi:hypothetical protein
MLPLIQPSCQVHVKPHYERLNRPPHCITTCQLLSVYLMTANGHPLVVISCTCVLGFGLRPAQVAPFPALRHEPGLSGANIPVNEPGQGGVSFHVQQIATAVAILIGKRRLEDGGVRMRGHALYVVLEARHENRQA